MSHLYLPSLCRRRRFGSCPTQGVSLLCNAHSDLGLRPCPKIDLALGFVRARHGVYDLEDHVHQAYHFPSMPHT